MSRFVYRCNKCRTRNTFKRAVSNWTPIRGAARMLRKEVDRLLRQIGGKRCRNCGHTSFYVDKERINRESCNCSGYHWAHRPGSQCCEKNPKVDMFRAYRQGLDDDDIAFYALNPTTPLPGNACPF